MSLFSCTFQADETNWSRNRIWKRWHRRKPKNLAYAYVIFPDCGAHLFQISLFSCTFQADETNWSLNRKDDIGVSQILWLTPISSFPDSVSTSIRLISLESARKQRYGCLCYPRTESGCFGKLLKAKKLPGGRRDAAAATVGESPERRRFLPLPEASSVVASAGGDWVQEGPE